MKDGISAFNNHPWALASMTKAVAALFVFVSIVGIFFCTQNLRMMGGNDMGMTTAYEMAQACDGVSVNLCGMSIASHIDAWRNMFDNSILPFVYIVFAFFLSAVSFVALQSLGRDNLFSYERYQKYRREHPNLLTYRPFVELFSQGILQPTLYA